MLLYEEYGARLVVLDIMLPDRDGFYVLEKIRTESNTPVLIVSAKTEKEDKFDKFLHYLVGGSSVQGPCRLIGKNHFRIVHHTAADTRPLKLTTRNLVDGNNGT